MDMNLKQLITKPTRITATTQSPARHYPSLLQQFSAC